MQNVDVSGVLEMVVYIELWNDGHSADGKSSEQLNWLLDVVLSVDTESLTAEIQFKPIKCYMTKCHIFFVPSESLVSSSRADLLDCSIQP